MPAIAFRIGREHWIEDAPFQRLMDLFRKHPGVVDEMVYFD